MTKIIDFEGTRKLTTVYQPHEDTMYVEHDSSDFERELYNQNARLRQAVQSGKGPVRLHLQMSEQDYAQLLAQYPVLRTGTSRQRRRMWEKIAKSRPELVAMRFEQRSFQGGGINAR